MRSLIQTPDCVFGVNVGRFLPTSLKEEEQTSLNRRGA